MKIGIYVNTLPTTVYINRLIEAIVKRGHEVVVFGTQIKEFQQVKGAKYVYYKLHSRLNFSKFFFYLNYEVRLRIAKPKQKKVLDQFLAAANKGSRHNKTQFYPILWHAPEVLHAQWLKGVEQFLWIQKFNMKLLVSLRGSHIYVTPNVSPEYADVFTKTFVQIDGFHSVCDDLTRVAQRFNLPTEKAMTIYSGIDLDEYDFVKPSQKKRAKEQPLRIVSLGRASWIKGYRVALDAMKLLKDEGVDFLFSIIGSKGDEELSFQINDLGLENHVHLLPWQNMEQVKTLIHQADITLVPSHSEGIANVAIESMALGTLVVSTSCGGMKELITNDVSGILVPIRDAAAMAQALKFVDQMEVEERDVMAINGRNKVKSTFQMKDKIKEFEAFYTANHG